MDEYQKMLSSDEDVFLRSVSIDCVIFSFYEGEIKILLNKFKKHDQWMLPGGFVLKEESLHKAAYRILYLRTKLKNCYLKQFHTFGEVNRTSYEENKQMLLEINPNGNMDNHWFLQRFISVGYFAFVDYVEAKINATKNEDCKWFGLSEIPQLYSDHNAIINKAIRTLRIQINYIPIGWDLLPEKFTMSELRIIYETILAKKIDRRNFQRKILSYGLVKKLDESSKKFGIKETSLFSFNKEKYFDALENGISFF